MKERWHVRWFRRRALLYHLLVLILAPGCLYAAYWQIQRAKEGNTLSYLYSVEWPIFAIMAVVGWWQLIHEEPAAVEARKVERARRAANKGPFVPPPPETESGFYQPLPAGARGLLGTAGTNGSLTPLGVGGHGAAVDDDGEPVAVHALSSYNAYLAKLSAGGGRKSWRNPRGVTAAMTDDDRAPALDGGGTNALGGARTPPPLPAPPGPAAPTPPSPSPHPVRPAIPLPASSAPAASRPESSSAGDE